MSTKTLNSCRKCSLILCFMLLLQVTKAQDKYNKIDAWLKDNTEILGGRVVLVIYKNGVVYSKAINNLNPGQKITGKIIARRQGKDPPDAVKDFTISTPERIASSSKWLSAALVMTFVDEGKLNIYDTVGKFLPVMTRHGKGNITIWECMSHLTGIQPGTLKESLEMMKKVNTMDEAIELIASQPMEGIPGKTFHYSNVGLQIAAAVIEKISGKDFETLFAERIARPCKMKNTDFGKQKVPLAAGGAFSTAEDYLNFLVMILNNGKFEGKQVLNASSVTAMQKNYIKGADIKSSPAEAGSWGYGFGEWVMEEKGRTDGVSSPGLFGSFPWVDNKRNYAGFLFCFNLKNKGRNERYRELKRLADEAITE